MAGTPIDLSAYKPVAGQPEAAAPISNAMTAIEAYTANAIDPASLKQNAATIGQTMQWDGTKWAPGPTLVAPTIIGPTASPNTQLAPTANQAYLYPVSVVVPTSISRLGFYVGSGGGTGNTDMGIYYSDDEATFTRLVSKGSTVTPANGPAVFTITPTVITPLAGRRWYLAIACNSATPAFGLCSNAFLVGNFSKTSSFPLPASITAATNSTQPYYMYGMV